MIFYLVYLSAIYCNSRLCQGQTRQFDQITYMIILFCVMLHISLKGKSHKNNNQINFLKK